MIATLLGMTIVEFLEARIAEDEAIAREAIVPHRPGTHWVWEAPDDDGDPESPRWLRTVEEFPTTSGVGDLPGLPLGSDCMASPSAAMPHIARHDPARVLRQCEAMRAIVGDYKRYLAEERRRMNGWVTEKDSPIVLALASIWSDHPDYRVEWV